jgi:hypothetical protein
VLAFHVGLAGERHQRRAVEEGVGDGGDEVRRPGPERAQADAGAAGQPAVDVGDVGAALLVADRDELDVAAGEGLVQIERLLAGNAEDALDALGSEALDQELGDGGHGGEGYGLGGETLAMTDFSTGGLRRGKARDRTAPGVGWPRCSPAGRAPCSATTIAPRVPRHALESSVNEADRLDLVDPETLRAAIEQRPGQPGTRPLRVLLDRDTFRLTESELERRFLPIARAAGLSPPRTQATVNGYRVDFNWPELGLVLETDGLRYHRTA